MSRGARSAGDRASVDFGAAPARRAASPAHIAGKDRAVVDDRHDSVEHTASGSAARGCLLRMRSRRAAAREAADCMTCRIVNSAHQNVCPRLKKKLKWLAWPMCWFREWLCDAIIDVDRIDGRIQVIAEIESDGPDRRVIAQAQPGGMREVIETARPALARGVDRAVRVGKDDGRGLGLSMGIVLILARVPVRLAKAQQARPYIAGVVEDVAHILKNHEAQRYRPR